MGRQSSDSDCLPSPVGAVSAIAAGQRGLVTSAQLATLGFTKARRESWIRSGRLHRVFRGVYVFGRPMLSQHGRWLAAVLACGPGACLSHLSAALLWGLVVAEGQCIDVTAPRSRTSRPGIDVHRPLRPPAIVEHLGIPVTTIARTVEDLSRTFAPGPLRRLVGEAELRPEFDPDALPPRLWSLVADPVDGAPPNRLESRFLRICEEAGLPRPLVNQDWGDWNIDFLWPRHRVAVETDGRAVHARRTQFSRDRRKDRDLQLAGYLALRFTHHEVMRRPTVVTDALRAALQAGKAATTAAFPAQSF